MTDTLQHNPNLEQQPLSPEAESQWLQDFRAAANNFVSIGEFDSRDDRYVQTQDLQRPLEIALISAGLYVSEANSLEAVMNQHKIAETDEVQDRSLTALSVLAETRQNLEDVDINDDRHWGIDRYADKLWKNLEKLDVSRLNEFQKDQLLDASNLIFDSKLALHHTHGLSDVVAKVQGNMRTLIEGASPELRQKVDQLQRKPQYIGGLSGYIEAGNKDKKGTTDEVLGSFNIEITKGLLGMGFSQEQASDMYEQWKSQKKAGAESVAKHLQAMYRLYTSDPNYPLRAREEFGIRHFGRYISGSHGVSLERQLYRAKMPQGHLATLKKYDVADPDIMITATADHNAAFKSIESRVNINISNAQYDFYEASNAAELRQAQEHYKSVYGHAPKRLAIGAHGSRSAFHLGPDFVKDRVTRRNLSEAGLTIDDANEVAQDDIVMLSCSTGKWRGIAEKIAAKSGVKVIASTDVSSSKIDDRTNAPEYSLVGPARGTRPSRFKPNQDEVKGLATSVDIFPQEGKRPRREVYRPYLTKRAYAVELARAAINKRKKS